MKLRLTWVVILMALASGLGCTQPWPAPTLSADELREVLEKSIREIGVPGAVAGVRFPGGRKIVQAAGIGEIATQEPIEMDDFGEFIANRKYNDASRTHITGRPLSTGDAFCIGSVTKTFVAALALRVFEAGGIPLDRRIDEWLPQWPGGDKISLRHLLNHTSGIPNYTEHPDFYDDLQENPAGPWPPEKLLAYATYRPSYFEPGQGWRYSNTNYILLGLILETVAGRSLGEQMEAVLIRPFRLPRTHFDPRGLETGLCHGYRYDFQTPGTWRDQSRMIDSHFLWTAGGMISTVPDLLDWLAVLLDGPLLSPAAKSEMLGFTETGIPGLRYGLGLQNKEGLIGHEGDFAFGFQAAIFRAGGVDLVVLTNGQPAQLGLIDGPWEICKNIIELLELNGK